MQTRSGSVMRIFIENIFLFPRSFVFSKAFFREFVSAFLLYFFFIIHGHTQEIQEFVVVEFVCCVCVFVCCSSSSSSSSYSPCCDVGYVCERANSFDLYRMCENCVVLKGAFRKRWSWLDMALVWIKFYSFRWNAQFWKCKLTFVAS